MNVSRVGMMTQPSFKGWVSDGQVAVREEAVTMIKSASPSSYASMRLFNGEEINTRLNTKQLLNALDKAKADGNCQVSAYSFMA